MIIRVQWRKVWRDMLSNKIRTILVVLSIAVGVFAIGMVAGTYEIVSRDLTRSYAAVNPAAANIYSSQFRPEFIETVQKIKGVTGAEGRSEISVRVRTGPDEEWRKLSLTVIPDYNDIRINKFKLISGAWPPPEKQMLLERSGLPMLKAGVGETVEIECSDHKKTTMRIAGVVHDINQMPAVFSDKIYGYITMDTMTALGMSRGLDTVNITVAGNPPSKEYIGQVAQKVWDKLEKSGYQVQWMYKNNPNEHPAQSIINALLLILGFMGILSLVLSGFLLVNTISSLLTQQVRQIGVMKAIGASNQQIIYLYMAYVACYSVMALCLSVPSGIIASRLVAGFIAGFLNFDITGLAISYPILFAEIAAGIAVPILAALYPIVRGARITVREAINSYGVSDSASHDGGWIGRITMRFRKVSRPLIISLRNTFRRKGRLALTLITLTISGVIFISICSVRQSMLLTLDDALDYFKYDIEVYAGKWYKTSQLEQAVLEVPGVAEAESWSFDSGRLLKSEDKESESTTIEMLAPPYGSKMLKPIILEGRWLLPEDENAVVINTEVLKDNPEIKIGDQLIIKLTSQERRKTHWTVVGIVRGVMTGPIIYANYSYFSRVIGKPGQGICVFCVASDKNPAVQSANAKLIEKHFKESGLQVGSVHTMADIRQRIESQFDVLVLFMLVMAVILACVGGLGLMGTMSINVIERTREIGIMRSLGASNWAIRRIFIAEGIMIGIISWSLALLISLAVSKVFSDQVGNAFMHAPFSFTFSIGGTLLWLVIVIVLAALASFLPAWNASRLSIRETLSYE